MADEEYIDGQIPDPGPAQRTIYNTPALQDRISRCMTMAHQMQAEAHEMPMDTQYRKNKLLGKYEDLHNLSPGLFFAALEEKLDKDGDEIGKIVGIFTGAKGDMSKLKTGFDRYLMAKLDPLRRFEEEQQERREYERRQQQELQNIVRSDSEGLR